ncbi:MAG TPA: hypothetical protein VE467_06815, partial [Chryseolinea sp.]|nr:hypothetical protein [Chryseolinea sp.]
MKLFSRALMVLSLFVLGCDEKSESPEYPDLRIYLDRFEQEAKARGYDFDLSNVQIVYVDNINVNNVTYCGFGFPNFNGSGLRRIEISKAEHCHWLTLSDILRENFVFHELGHAFFNRGHDDALLCDGTAASLMTSGALDVYAGPGDKRDYYIRELIDPLVANTKCIQNEKDWSKESAFYQISKDDEDWILYTDNGKFVGTRSTMSEPDEYLTLSSIPGISTPVNAYWFKAFRSPNIPECAEVKFKVKMNSPSLVGTGAAISVRVYKNTLTKFGALTEQSLRVSTEDDPATGELLDVSHEITVPCYSRSTDQLLIFVVL